MIIAWAEMAWEDYLFWQHTDKKIIKSIITLIKDIKQESFKGIGSPEPLKHNWSGY